jgi:hypothetical protein
MEYARWALNPFSSWGLKVRIQAGTLLKMPAVVFDRIAVVPDIFVKAKDIFQLAISIGMDAHEVFETYQWPHKSSFSEEDLTSDLIGFYIGVQQYLTGRSFDAMRADIEKLCDAFTGEESAQVFDDTYAKGARAVNGWQSWYPRLLPLLDCSGNLAFDLSSHQGRCNFFTSRQLPSEFSNLAKQRIPEGNVYQYGTWWWMPVYPYYNVIRMIGVKDHPRLYQIDYVPLFAVK